MISYPRFNTIPHINSKHLELFCQSELLLYKHLRDIELDIGLTKESTVTNWTNVNSNEYQS